MDSPSLLYTWDWLYSLLYPTVGSYSRCLALGCIRKYLPPIFLIAAPSAPHISTGPKFPPSHALRLNRYLVFPLLWWNMRGLVAFTSLISFSVLSVLGSVTWDATPFNPASIPLAVRSPYFSAWLSQGAGTALNAAWPTFWTGSVSMFHCCSEVAAYN